MELTGDEVSRVEDAAALLGLGRPAWRPDRAAFRRGELDLSIALPALVRLLRDRTRAGVLLFDALALAGGLGIAPPPEALRDFDLLRPLLRPRLLHPRELTGPRRAMCRRESVGGLMQAIALGPEWTAPLVTSASLDRWPVSFEEALDLALGAMRGAVTPNCVHELEDAPGVAAVVHPHEVVSSALPIVESLLPGQARDLGVVAAVPAPEVLLLLRVVPRDGVRTLAGLVDASLGLYNQSNDPLHDQLVWWRDGRLEPLTMTFVQERGSRRVQFDAEGAVGDLLRILGAVD
ncbi:MAG TPA: hypothetical protein DEB06_09160 [Phycisphaerales bacterium]|nr:hypothetical protein [Phycisphaerales bacterium]